MRTRRFLTGLNVGDWLVGSAGLGLFGVLLWVLGLFWVWGGAGAVGFGLALGLRHLFDLPAERERQHALDATTRLLRRMRMQGLDEEEIRQFVARFAGRRWEEYFETLFGYEAKIAARAVLSRGEAAGPRDKFAAWRDPLIGLITYTEKARREAKERHLLAAVERARLLADGLGEQAAADRAAVAAEAMLRQADRFRTADARRADAVASTGSGRTPPPGSAKDLQRVVDAADNPGPRAAPPADGRVIRVAAMLVGPHVRAMMASLLLAGCTLWAQQNGYFPAPDHLRERAAAAHAARMAEDGLDPSAAAGPQPLWVPGLPHDVTGWVDGYNAGVAGLLLLSSLFFRGGRMGLCVLIGAGITVAGHRFGIRTVEPLQDRHVALMLGATFCLVGFRVGRR